MMFLPFNHGRVIILYNFTFNVLCLASSVLICSYAVRERIALKAVMSSFWVFIKV